MKVALATVGDAPWNTEFLASVRELAESDSIGTHTVTDSYADADIVLVLDSHQYPNDWSMRSYRRSALLQQFANKLYVYDERDDPVDFLPGVYVSLPAARFDTKRHRAFSYSRLITGTQSISDKAPDLLASFVGRNVTPLRHRILDSRDPRILVEDSSHLNFFAGAKGAELEGAKDRYLRALARSRFVLCPRGTGTSSFRIFESLACGRVPVILSDDWVPPADIPWAKCSVRAAENCSLPVLFDELAQLSPNWAEMSRAAEDAYRRWFAPDVWFHRVVEDCRELSGSGKSGPNPLFWAQRAVWRSGMRLAKARVKRGVGR